MLHIVWGPWLPAAFFGSLAAVCYLANWFPRLHAFFGAAALVFLAGGTGLLALAHHPLTSGPARNPQPTGWQVAVIIGAVLSVGLFIYVVIFGNHKQPIVKRRSKRSAGSAGPNAAATPSKGSHPKAAHHRSLAVTTCAVVFGALLAFNLGSIWHGGRGGASQTGSQIVGMSQTFSGITQ